MKGIVFVVGAVILAVVAGAYDWLMAPPPDGESAIADHVSYAAGRATGIVIAGLFLGFIAWAALRHTPAAKYVRDGKTCSLAGAALVVVGHIAFGALAGPGSDRERDAFAASLQRTCFPTQRSDAGNRGMSDEQLHAYCRCYAENLRQRITGEEMTYIGKNKAIPASFQAKINEAALTCAGTL